MYKKITTIVLFFILVGFSSVSGFAQTLEESLKKAFPKLQFDSLSPSNIKGIYEVITPNGLLYYSPETENIIVGEIIKKDGSSLTQARYQEVLSKAIKGKMQDIPFDKAIKIGAGKHSIIEFTDPDCPYCRRASDFFSKRTDVTRYIFFYPLDAHPQAKDKALYVLCAEDKAKAYEEAMTGKLDDMKFKKCDDQQAQDVLKSYIELAGKLGVRGTPFFFIDGQTAVPGADIPKIEKLLGTGQ